MRLLNPSLLETAEIAKPIAGQMIDMTSYRDPIADETADYFR